jgi:hypothetical protein
MRESFVAPPREIEEENEDEDDKKDPSPPPASSSFAEPTEGRKALRRTGQPSPQLMGRGRTQPVGGPES